MIANSFATIQAVNVMRDALIRYESTFAPLSAQIDGALFCRALLAQIDGVLGSALEQPVTLEKAAKLSGYSSEHLRRLIREGQLATYRAEGERKHRVLPSEVPKRHRGARSNTPAAEPHASKDVVPRTPAAPALALPRFGTYDPIADARSVLARVRGAHK
jgi:hypothetical protein